MDKFIYVLCMLTSVACAFFLLRGYLVSRYRLLLWSGLCFVGLSINNILLLLDKQVFPDVDLFSAWRPITALVSLLPLLYGLIWEEK